MVDGEVITEGWDDAEDGEPEAIAPELSKRYGDVVSRISFYAPYKSDPERWGKVMSALKAA